MGSEAFLSRQIVDTTVLGREVMKAVDAAAARIIIGAGTSSFGGAYADLTGKPTTLAGYGITDAAAASHTHLQSEVTGLTTALAAKADLVGGLVPASQLPSFVDDVLEFANLSSFPGTGEPGKIYVAVDTSRTYRWSGSAYVELTDSTAVWGSLSGVLANQTDLASALAGKANVLHNQSWSTITATPTTLAGYGITDAAAANHTHGNLTNAGAIGNTAGLPIITGTSGVLQAGAFGSISGTFCQGNDARLSDARTPLSHTHLQSDVTGLTTALAAKADLVGGLVPANQLPGFVDDVLEFANLAAFPATGESGKIYVALDTSRTYRWGGTTYTELTDSTAVWGSISGVLTNQTDLASALAGKSNTGHQHAAADISSGTIATARLGTGTASASTYLRGDQTWQTIAAGGISTLNTLTDATQTFQTGTTGTDFAIASAAGVHTFNLPDASATARGAVNTGVQTIAGTKTFTGNVTFSGPGNPNVTAGNITCSTINASVNAYTVQANAGRCSLFNHFNAGGGFGYGFTVGTGVPNPPDVLMVPVAATTADLGRIRIRYGSSPCGFFVANTYTSATSYEEVGIDWQSNVAILDTRKGSGGGLPRGLKIGGSATSLIGLWGVTPVAQPTTAITGAARIAGTGNAVTDTDTFGGLTLGQIAAVLKIIGAYA